MLVQKRNWLVVGRSRSLPSADPPSLSSLTELLNPKPPVQKKAGNLSPCSPFLPCSPFFF